MSHHCSSELRDGSNSTFENKYNIDDDEKYVFLKGGYRKRIGAHLDDLKTFTKHR